MHQSKHVAIAFLLGAVLVGGALGFTADRMLTRDRRGDGPLDMLDQRLSLTNEQRAKFDAILDDRRRQLTLVYESIEPKMDSIRHNARAQMRQVLDSTQRAEFERFLAEMNDSTKRRRK